MRGRPSRQSATTYGNGPSKEEGQGCIGAAPPPFPCQKLTGNRAPLRGLVCPPATPRVSHFLLRPPCVRTALRENKQFSRRFVRRPDSPARALPRRRPGQHNCARGAPAACGRHLTCEPHSIRVQRPKRRPLGPLGLGSVALLISPRGAAFTGPAPHRSGRSSRSGCAPRTGCCSGTRWPSAPGQPSRSGQSRSHCAREGKEGERVEERSSGRARFEPGSSAGGVKWREGGGSENERGCKGCGRS